MKHSLILSILVLSTSSGFAQKNDANAIQEAKRIYAEVEKADLKTEKIEVESEDGLQIYAEKMFDQSGTARKMVLDIVAGDHGGFGVSIYYNADQQPVFVLWEDNYWTFNQKIPNTTIDYVSEWRLYFGPGSNLARALEKKYQGSGEAEIKKNRDKAVNKKFTPQGENSVSEFYKNISNLAITNDQTIGRRTEDLLGIWDLIQGRE